MWNVHVRHTGCARRTRRMKVRAGRTDACRTRPDPLRSASLQRTDMQRLAASRPMRPEATRRLLVAPFRTIGSTRRPCGRWALPLFCRSAMRRQRWIEARVRRDSPRADALARHRPRRLAVAGGWLQRRTPRSPARRSGASGLYRTGHRFLVRQGIRRPSDGVRGTFRPGGFHGRASDAAVRIDGAGHEPGQRPQRDGAGQRPRAVRARAGSRL